MSKMGSHDPFGHLQHKLWPKEGPGVEWAIWLPTTKSRESTRFPCVRWRATYHWKALNESYNFALDLISIRSMHVRLWAPMVTKVPVVGISGFTLGSLGTKCHLDVGLVERHKVYYKGQGGGFPQVRPMVSLVSPSCSWLILAPKMFQLCTNHFVLVLCKSVWVIDACHSS
jgi:hypothetical protein